MSSFELLELFGGSVVDPEMRTVIACVTGPDGRAVGEITIPVDEAGLYAEKPQRTIRIEFAPEDGVLADALRDGNRSEWKQMLAQSANELAVISVVQAPEADRDEYGSRLFLPMDRMRELIDDEQLRIEQVRSSEFDGDGMSSMWQQEVS